MQIEPVATFDHAEKEGGNEHLKSAVRETTLYRLRRLIGHTARFTPTWFTLRRRSTIATFMQRQQERAATKMDQNRIKQRQ